MVEPKTYEISEIISVNVMGPRFFGKVRVVVKVKRMRSPWTLELNRWQLRELLPKLKASMMEIDADR